MGYICVAQYGIEEGCLSFTNCLTCIMTNSVLALSILTPINSLSSISSMKYLSQSPSLNTLDTSMTAYSTWLPLSLSNDKML